MMGPLHIDNKAYFVTSTVIFAYRDILISADLQRKEWLNIGSCDGVSFLRGPDMEAQSSRAEGVNPKSPLDKVWVTVSSYKIHSWHINIILVQF